MQRNTKKGRISPPAVIKGVIVLLAILGGIAVPAVMLVANLAIRGFGPAKPKAALLCLLPMAVIGGLIVMMGRSAKRNAHQEPAKRAQEPVKVPPALLAYRGRHAHS